MVPKCTDPVLSMKQNLLLVEDVEKLNNVVTDTVPEKPDETPSIECKGQAQVENEAPVSEETQSEDIAKANESTETAALVDPSTEKVSHRTAVPAESFIISLNVMKK